MKHIYFLVVLFLTGMLQAQNRTYQYDQTGNRTGRTTATDTTTSTNPLVQKCQASPQESLLKEKYTPKTGNGETVYEITPQAIDLLPSGFQPSVHTEVVLPGGEPLDEETINIQPTAPSTSVNTQKEVGEIPLLSSVENGSITYTVPIDIYPGRNGFQPQISFTYNSMAGNGVAGYGWNTGGLSAITPIHSNYYYDGNNAQPETMGVNDPAANSSQSISERTGAYYSHDRG